MASYHISPNSNNHRRPPTSVFRHYDNLPVTYVSSHPTETRGLRCNLSFSQCLTKGDCTGNSFTDAHAFRWGSYFSYPHSLRGTLLLTGRSLLLNLIRIRAPLFQPGGST